MPRCPVCKTPIDLIRYEGVPIYNCGSCGGHWLTHAKLNVIVARRELVMPPAVQQKMIELADASDSRQELWCLLCGRAMTKEYFKHWSAIRIDRCTKCQGMWLDRGELEKCQIYWEYMIDHPESPAADQWARVAALDALWSARRAQSRADAEGRTGAVRPSTRFAASGDFARILTGLFGS